MVLCLMGCGPQEDPPASEAPVAGLETQLLGTWETIEIEVTAPTYGGEDTTIVDHIREADWGQVYGVRPARTVFTPDGKLRRTHRLKTGQVANITNGLWRAQGSDSLILIEPNVTYLYAYTIEGERLELEGTVDYDLDGEADDDYRAVLRLVSRTGEN